MQADPGCLDEYQALAFTAGDLDRVARSAIEDHLDRCAACRRLVAALALASSSGRPRPRGESLRAGARLGDYVVLEPIGRGGMGEVYSAYATHLLGDDDHARGTAVALKLLPDVDPRALVRFKHEFRALADVSHRNLVQLYELSSIDGRWFFSMELVDGVDFVTYVRGGDAGIAPRLDRLGPALVELAAGLEALHHAGHVHRDVKPSNVLVERSGRVVLLDFGAVAELGAARAARETIGTPAYMAPEQRRGEAVTPASDWFAVGVMVYEALAGQRPFSPHDPDRPIRPLSEVVAGVPPALARLCAGLLSPEAERRPGAAEIDALHDRPARDRRRAGADRELAGRAREATTLAAALDAEPAGRGRAVLVTGPSGIGKTFLVEHVVEAMIAARGGTALRARCHDRETIPYKALDPLIDAIAGRIAHASAAARAAIAPELAEMFPAIGAALPGSPARPSTEDPHARRRRAIASLGALLRELARSGPVILWIDDLQWGDEDSAAVLAELLGAPGAGALRFVGTARSLDGRRGAFVERLFSAEAGASVDRAVIELGGLDDHAAAAMARALLDDPAPDTVAHVVAEAEGNPFFITELARQAQVGALPRRGASLDQAISLRAARLPAPARAVLHAAASAGRPLRASVAVSVAEVARDGTAALASLRAGRWIHVAPGPDGAVQLVHDRLRQAVVAQLAPDAVRAIHGRIAAVEEAAGRAPPDVLAEHWRRAGEPLRAATCAEASAELATAGLAFDRAVELLSLAITLRGPSASSALHARRGAALASAGRGAEAADAYRVASRDADPARSLEYRRLAAEQLLRSGRIDAGLAAMRRVLDALGLPPPANARHALVALAVQRARLRFTRIPRRPPDRADPEALDRIDVCWAVAAVLGTVDTVPAAELQTRALLLAIRHGDARRLARSLAGEAAFGAIAGRRHARRTASFLDRAREVAAASDDRRVDAEIAGADGLAAFLEARWARARALCQRASHDLRMHGGAAWERYTVDLYALFAAYYLGDLHDMREEVGRQLADAEARGDLYIATSLRSALTNSAWLAADDPASARAQVERAEQVWSKTGFHLQHYWTLLSKGQIDLYDADRAGYDRLRARWAALDASRLLRIQVVRVEAFYLRGRLACLDGGPAARRDAAACARRLRDEDADHARGLGRLVEASVAAARGEPGHALEHLDAAAAILAGCDMAGFAAAARWVAAARRGDAAARATAEGILRDRGIVDVARMSATWIPWPRG